MDTAHPLRAPARRRRERLLPLGVPALAVAALGLTARHFGPRPEAAALACLLLAAWRDGRVRVPDPAEPALGRRWAAPLTRRPALTAALAAAVVTALAWRIGARPELAAFAWFGTAATALAIIDAETKRLPDPLTLPSYPVGIALLGAAAPFTADGGARYLQALICMGALWLLYAAQWFLLPGRLGFGDVKLAGICGLHLGWLGPGAVIVGAMAGHVIFLPYALALLVTGGAGRRTQLPYGPFMIAGALLAVLVYAPASAG